VENGYRLRKELFAFTDNKVCSPSSFMGAEPRVSPRSKSWLIINRSRYNSGTNGTTPRANGGELMDLKTGRLRRMGG
jgi:hypothetical protein